MITIEVLCMRVEGLSPADVERWIDRAWVRPDGDIGHYEFQDIDVERARLILDLRDRLQVNEDALPVVLGLLDQVYELRRRMRELHRAIDATASDDLRRELVRRLTGLA